MSAPDGIGRAVDLRTELIEGRWVLMARRDTAEGRVLNLTRVPRRLSEQQSRILERSALGESGKGIAIDLGVGDSTVSMQLTTALDRLRLTRSEVGTLLGGGCGGCPFEVVAGSSATDEGLTIRLQVGTALHQLLTSAELEVLTMVFEGRKNGEIAVARRRSARTIANQLASSFRKLRVASRAELFARWAPPAPTLAGTKPG